MAGNAATAAGPSTTFTVDNTAPGVTISTPSATVTRTAAVTYGDLRRCQRQRCRRVTLEASNVTLNKTGTANGILAVTGSGTSTRTVTISGISGMEPGVLIASGTATDVAGNSAGVAGPEHNVHRR